MRRPSVTTIDPIDIALSHDDSGDGSLARRLLSQQIELFDAQKNEISVRNALVNAQLSEIRIKRLLWAGIVAAMLGLMILLATAMVNASRSHALIVEPFHVPASLGARGLDGSAMAARMIDRFAVIRDQSDSSRAEDSYANGGDNDIKIAIPNTGVSVGDVWRYLRDWLGHDRKIGGDVMLVGDQVEITARISGGKGESFRASLADPTPAIEAAAASIFKQTQPYRYALVIARTKGPDASIPLMRDLAEQGEDLRERQWGYVGWDSELSALGRFDEAALRLRQGIVLDPAFGKIYSNLANDQVLMGQAEAAMAAYRQALGRLHSPAQSQLSLTGFGHVRDGTISQMATMLGDNQAALTVLQHEGTLPEYNGNSRSARMNTLVTLARLGEFRRVAASLPLLPFADPAFAGQAKFIAAEFARQTGRTDKALALIEQTIASVKLPKGKSLADVLPTVAAEYAEMLVAAGRAGDAAKAIAPTRLDCYRCLVSRGEVAAAQHDLPAATRWLAEAARQGPSLPQADYQWGKMLAANHNRPAALAHFAVAAKRAPGWYEPPYASGRILMAQNHFAEARAALEQGHAAAHRRADVMLALGRAQWLGGDRSTAKATWLAARKLDLLERDLAWLKVIDAAMKRAS